MSLVRCALAIRMEKGERTKVKSKDGYILSQDQGAINQSFILRVLASQKLLQLEQTAFLSQSDKGIANLNSGVRSRVK